LPDSCKPTISVDEVDDTAVVNVEIANTVVGLCDAFVVACTIVVVNVSVSGAFVVEVVEFAPQTFSTTHSESTKKLLQQASFVCMKIECSAHTEG
jgi:hypothetical protein